MKLDLRIPMDCRKFLEDIKVDCKSVTEVILHNGETLKIADMTDEQAVRYANDLYFELFGGKDGGGMVDTHINTGTN